MLLKNEFYIKNGIEIDKQLISNLITGTAPLVIKSTTVVNNLNADLLDGFQASDFVKTTDSFYIGTTEVPLNRTSTSQSLTGIVSIDGTASSLTNARSITISGDGNCTFSFDGSSDITTSFTLSNSSVTPGIYNKVTVDSKGRVTSGENVDLLSSVSWDIITNKPSTLSGYGIPNSDITTIISNSDIAWSKITDTPTTLAGYGIPNSDITTIISNSNIAWSKITNKPTTVGGYGITDAATLVGGKIPANQLPSYVDEIVEYTLFSQFPNPGSSGKIYLALDKPNDFYRWVFSPGSTTTGHYVDMSGLGSVVTADVLSTTRKFTIGNTFKLFNGGDDVTWTLDEIGALSKTATINLGTTSVPVNRLSTALTLNDVSITGSAAKLTTAKNFTIGAASAKPFDGTTPVTWTLDEIGALSKTATINLGTTPVPVNRLSAALTLNDVSITGSAAKLTTAKNFTIGAASAKPFDGTAPVTWTLDEIGALSKTNSVQSFETKSIGSIIYTTGYITEILYTDGSKQKITYNNGSISKIDYYTTNGTTILATQVINYSTNDIISSIIWN